MTNEIPTTEYWQVVFRDPLPLSYLIAWLAIPLLVLWTVWTIGRWLWRRNQKRDPTSVVVACVLQFALYLLLGFNTDLRNTFLVDCTMVPDQALLLLCVTQMLQGLFLSGLTGLLCSVMACGVARRLPQIPIHTVVPVLLALVDTFLSVCWLLWLFTLKP